MANPVLSEKKFKTISSSIISNAEEQMSLQGTLNKTYIVFGLMVLSAFFTWYQIIPAFHNISLLWTFSVAAGFFVSLFLSFNPRYAPTLAPVYAIIEGVFLAAISFYFENVYHGIVMQAALGTVVTFGIMLTLYRARIIKVTKRFHAIVVGATLAVMTYYLISFLMGLFMDIQLFDWSKSLISIGFSIFVIVLAALNLALDFDRIEKGVAYGSPKYMEWYSAFGLLVTVVWLYFEILRLLAKNR